jgi:hypothetical protein
MSEEKLIFEIKTVNGGHLGFIEEGTPFDFDGLELVIERVERTKGLDEYLKSVKRDG